MPPGSEAIKSQLDRGGLVSESQGQMLVMKVFFSEAIESQLDQGGFAWEIQGQMPVMVVFSS
jgi:hypothetical protein